MSTPESILSIYDRVGPAWAQTRDRRLVERKWLDRMIAVAPHLNGVRRVLDVGCGAGRPIAEYLSDRGIRVTGIDGAESMVALFSRLVPDARVYHADMRKLDLGMTFDAILAWDSFFHLSPSDQKRMFAIFAAHSAPGAALMFTSGPDEGISIGQIEGEPLYHASLSPADYTDLLTEAGFSVVTFKPEDPDCSGHSVWLARYTA